MAGHALRQGVEVFRRDIEGFGIVCHVARLAVAIFEHTHEAVEELSRARTPLFGVLLLRIAVEIIVEAEKESLKLEHHQLVETDAAILPEINTEQGEHIGYDIREHLRLRAAAVGLQL